MTIKKILRMAPLAILLAIAIPASSTTVVPNTTPIENPRAQQLLQRLEEIKDINKSELSSSEKRDLRKEVRGIKKEMKAISGGVYLSVGAIIIVILLLILLL